MIILIGGTSCTGKTKLAYDLMIKYGIPYFSLDILMMGIYRSISKCGYTPLSTSEEIANVIWPIVVEMTKTNIENDSNCIYEGFQILPKNINRIEIEYRKSLKTIFLGFTEKYLLENYPLINKKRNASEKREDIDSLEKMIELNNQLIQQCKEWNQYIHLFDNDYVIEKDILIKEIEHYTVN